MVMSTPFVMSLSAAEFSQVPWDLVACPSCGARLEAGDNGVACKRCGDIYPVYMRRGLDLRLRKPRKMSLDFEIGAPLFPHGEPDFSPLGMNPNPEIDFRNVELPIHLSREMASNLPAPPHADSVCLELGCGGGEYRGPLEHAGYRWVGVDYSDQRAPMLAD